MDRECCGGSFRALRGAGIRVERLQTFHLHSSSSFFNMQTCSQTSAEQEELLTRA